MLGTESGEEQEKIIMKKISSWEDFLNIFIYAKIDVVDLKELSFHDVNLGEFFESFSYLPTEDRLAHKLGTKLFIENSVVEEKIWHFSIVSEVDREELLNIDLNYTDDLDKEVFSKYTLLLRLCLNGNLEDRDFLDNIGIIMKTSVWRCAYCGGIFGYTYQDCLDHEKDCLRNKQNIESV